jgi:hypothetical protein
MDHLVVLAVEQEEALPQLQVVQEQQDKGTMVVIRIILLVRAAVAVAVLDQQEVMSLQTQVEMVVAV